MHNKNKAAPVVPSNAPVVIVATENPEFLPLAETALAEAGLLALPAHHIHFDAALANFKHLDLNDIALVILQASSLARIDFAPWRKAFPPEGSTLLMAISTAQQDEEGGQAFEYADDVIILSPLMDETLMIRQIRQRIRVMTRLMQRFQVVPSGFSETEPISSWDAEYYRMRDHWFPGYRFSFARDKNGEYQREWGDETMLYRLTGYTLQEMEAKGGFVQILHPDDAKIDLEHRRRTRNGEAVISEMRVIHAQGYIVWVRLMNESFKDKTSGQVVRIHGFLQDITEQKRIEQLELEQRRMIEVLQNTAIMLSSSLDVETILDRILVNLELVIPYDLADVMIIDNGIARIARYRNYEQHGLGHVIDLLAYDVTKVETLRMMFETRKPFYIPDVREFAGWVKDPPASDSPIVSYLGAPVIVQDQIVAFLNVYGMTRNQFTAVQTDQMQVLASQVSVAINNAQLYDTVSRHSEELERHIGDLLMVYEAGHALASTLEVGEIYQMMYREVAQRMFNSQEMRIILYDYRSNLIRVVYEVIDGQPVVLPPQPALPLPSGPVETAIRSHHSHIVGLMIYEPLISRDHVVGVMEIRQGEPDSFDEVNVTLLSTVAAQAAVALDNAYLYAEVQSYASELEERVQERTAKLQEALRKSQEVSELRSRFLSNVQHEFRTPLTLILSASELLEKHGGRMTQEGRDSRHNTIREAVKEMVRLLDSSMIINQMDDGMLPMLPQATNVAMLTEACVQDFLRALPPTANANDRGNGAGVGTSTPPSTATVIEEKAVIKVERDGDCGIAFIDPDLWRRIMMELLSNAVRYSPATQDSPIIVSLDCDDNHLRLTVTDSGIGIPDDDLPHIFEMFQRGINVQNLPGSGLGLPMVKRITDLNGGNIVITSTIGKGTQATVTLPRYASKGDEHDYKQD